MRGSSAIWYRIRLNLRNVPEAQRPAQSTPDPDDDPTRAWREGYQLIHQRQVIMKTKTKQQTNNAGTTSHHLLPSFAA